MNIATQAGIFSNSAASSGGVIESPIHLWELDNLTTGLDDLGTLSWPRLTNNGASVSAGSGPNSQDVLSFAALDHLDRTDVAWDGASSLLSWSCWIKTNPSNPSNVRFLSWRKSSGERLMNGYISEGVNKYFRTALYGAADNGVGSGSDGESVVGSGWHHVAAAWDGTEYVAYFDGAEIARETPASAISSFETGTMPFSVGIASWSKTDSATGFIGEIMQPAMWDIELNLAKIQHIYNGGLGRSFSQFDLIP